MAAHPDCTRCGLHTTTSRVGLDGAGPVPAKLLLIGEGPGQAEETSGIPFVGAAGKLLDKALAEVGLARTDVRITNCVRCRPPSNRTPSQAELGACFPHLADELLDVQPKVILALGGTALKVLTGKGGITTERGKVLEPHPRVRAGEARVVATYHPAALLHHRGGNEYQHIVEDLRFAKVLAGLGTVDLPRHERRSLAPGYSYQQLWDALEWLDADRVAVDCEWTALRDRAIGWPWSRGAELYSIALAGRVGDVIRSVALAWPPPPDGVELLAAVLPQRKTVFHNAMADLQWLDSVGVLLRPMGDTMVLAHLLDEQQPLKLETLATQASIPPWKIDKTWDRRPAQDEWETLLGYNADDVYGTLLLEEELIRQVRQRPAEERNGIRQMYGHLLLPAIPTFVAMARTGVPIDRDALTAAITATRSRQHEAATSLADAVKDITPEDAITLANSTDQTQRLLHQVYGLEMSSSRKEQLNELVESCPAVPHILAIRRETKMAGTFLEPWEELFAEQGDNRLRSVYGIVNSRTGRTSAQVEKGGSLQVMPREPWVRKMVRARPGWMIVAGDYSQLELRIIAWLANERNMRQIYAESREADLHKATGGYFLALAEQRMTATEYWPVRHRYMERVTKTIRQASKGSNFSLCYGAEVDKFQAYTKQNYGVALSYEEATKYRAGFFELYPDLLPWHRQGVDIARRGWCVTPFGRYRRGLEDFRKAVNTPIQAMGTDLCVLALTEVHRLFQHEQLPAVIVGFVHDSIICEVRNDVVDDAVAIMRQAMEHPPMAALGATTIPVPLVADPEVSETWGHD